MTTAAVVDLMRQFFLTAFWISVPVLAVGFVVGIAISLAQILTSIQDSSFSSVPRLAAFWARWFWPCHGCWPRSWIIRRFCSAIWGDSRTSGTCPGCRHARRGRGIWPLAANPRAGADNASCPS